MRTISLWIVKQGIVHPALYRQLAKNRKKFRIKTDSSLCDEDLDHRLGPGTYGRIFIFCSWCSLWFAHNNIHVANEEKRQIQRIDVATQSKTFIQELQSRTTIWRPYGERSKSATLEDWCPKSVILQVKHCIWRFWHFQSKTSVWRPCGERSISKCDVGRLMSQIEVKYCIWKFWPPSIRLASMWRRKQKCDVGRLKENIAYESFGNVRLTLTSMWRICNSRSKTLHMKDQKPPFDVVPENEAKHLKLSKVYVQIPHTIQ